MCGIAGRINFTNAPVERTLLQHMCNAIAHRGPDDWGIYTDGPVGLGNRRLSIIDVSGGHQPIGNEDETIWVVFNGEIYNFPELANNMQCRGHHLKTHSDTEVLVHLYEEYGLDCLSHLNGMFAFAIWDKNKQRLFVARDRLGQKPLCYASTTTGLVFASEINALLQDPQIPRQLDLASLDLYLRLLCVPAPYTMFKAVRKLMPGHYMLVEDGRLHIKQYWDVQFKPKRKISETEAVEQVKELLEASVRRRLVSDVPLGAFLSGGIDSSAIVALMRQAGHNPIRTFSIGFEGFEDELKNDLPYAREMANHYGTQHEEAVVKPDVADLLPKLVRHYGEPFGDGSAVPTYYVSQLAASSVKVVLTGDGGDEVFGGYSWYLRSLARNPWLNMAESLGTATLRGLSAAKNQRWRQALDSVRSLGSTAKHFGHLAANPLQRYTSIHRWFDPTLLGQLYHPDLQDELYGQAMLDPIYGKGMYHEYSFFDQIAYLDHKIYLADDILAKVDIASMANSLEARSPFLDFRLVELVASLPESMKVDGNSTKRLLRRALHGIVPDKILHRPKMGFGPPMDKWLREDLFPMAQDLLLDSRAQQRNLFNHHVVVDLLERHHTNLAHYGYHLWLLLIFELWCRTYLDPT